NRGPMQGSRKGGTLVKRFSQIALILMLATAPILAGCAMTPNAVSDSSSAPAPGGSMAGSTGGGHAVGSAAGDRSGSGLQGAARPNPKEFTAKTDRSEERRVGKECRSRGWPDAERKKRKKRTQKSSNKTNTHICKTTSISD